MARRAGMNGLLIESPGMLAEPNGRCQAPDNLSPTDRMAVASLTGPDSRHEKWLSLSPNARGVIWVLVGCLMWTINDALVKATGRDLNPFKIAFIRYTIGVVLLMPVMVRLGLTGLKTARPGLHAGRVSIALAGQILAYYAVINMILADVTALNEL